MHAVQHVPRLSVTVKQTLLCRLVHLVNVLLVRLIGMDHRRLLLQLHVEAAGNERAAAGGGGCRQR